LPWLEARQEQYPQDPLWLRDLAVAYERLGDVWVALGQLAQAQASYEQALAISERLHRQEPQRADFAWDLVCSLVRMGQISGQRDYLERARDILRRLHAEGRLPHQQAAQGLDYLEEMLG
ncbi:MAG: tetratricopeptide repeat protein, partial [Fimbriimonadales bacterium]|nr:tetratricopeptide repeat protein [Fimbriimonadales bacterium]